MPSLPQARFLPVLAAAISTAALTLPFAPPAEARDGLYSVTLASPLAEPRREIVKGAAWRCEGTTCMGQVSGSRPVMTCKRVAKEFGEVASFSGPQGELTPEEIAECNAG